MLYRSSSLRIKLLSLILLTTEVSFASEQLAEATALYESGDSQRASGHLKQLLQAEPNNGAGRLLLGKIYLEQRQYPSAEKELRRARKLSPPTAEIDIALTRAYYGQHKLQAGLDLLNQLKPEPGKAGASIEELRGNGLLMQKKIDEAEQAFNKARALHSSPGALLGLARIAGARARYADGLALLDTLDSSAGLNPELLLLRGQLFLANNNPQDALKQYNELLSTIPDHPQALLGGAKSALAIKQYDSVQQHLEKLRSINSNNPEVLMISATLALEQEQFDTAQSEADRILAESPEHTDALFIAAQAHFYQQHFTLAERRLTHYLSRVENNPQAIHLLAATYQQQGRPDSVIATLQPLLKQEQPDPIALSLTAMAMIQQGTPLQGEALLEQALHQSPSERLSRQLALSQIYRGEPSLATERLLPLTKQQADPQTDAILIAGYLRQGNQEQALALIEQRITEAPQEVLYLLFKAQLQKDNKAFKAAITTYQSALALAPQQAAGLQGLAESSLALGLTDAAASALNDRLLMNRNDLSALLLYADVELQRQQPDRALLLLKEAKQRYPNASTPIYALTQWHLRFGSAADALKLAQEHYQQNRQHADAAQLLSSLYQQFGNIDQARKVLEKLVTDLPDNPTPTLLLTQFLSSSGNHRQALILLEKQLTHLPLHRPSRQQLIQILIQADRLNQAEKQLKHLPSQGAEAAITDWLKADILTAKKRGKEALTHYKKAYAVLKNAPLVAAINQNLLGSEGPQAAKKFLDSHLERHVDDAEALYIRAQLNDQIGNSEQALEDYRRLARMQPTNPAIANNLAWLLLDRNDPEALSFAQKAYELTPQSPSTQDTLGWIMLKQQQNPQRALQLIEQAQQQWPDNDEIRYHRAIALISVARQDEARRELAKLTERKNSFAALAAKALKSLPEG